MMRTVAAALGCALAFWLLVVGAASAAQDFSVICETAAREASRRSGVPLSVLKAISLAETGRKQGGSFRPWPWTVNMEGAGHWFDSQDEARAFVFKEFKRGARSFDIGCFQINYKWHSQAFSSIDEMFDPLENAHYAAKFLQELHAETGSWTKAAGAYHSRTPEFAEPYSARFNSFRAKFLTEDGANPGPPPLQRAGQDIPDIPDIVLAAYDVDPEPAKPRTNRYPLLQTGAAGGLSSLVPLVRGSGASLFPSPEPMVTD